MSSPAFWRDNASPVARKLKGKKMLAGKIEAEIIKAQGYRKHENKGVYIPVTEIPAGDVYCPKTRQVLLLIATHDSGQMGGCVLIREIKIGDEHIKGPGNVSKALGITDGKVHGSTEWIDDDTFRLRVEGFIK